MFSIQKKYLTATVLMTIFCTADAAQVTWRASGTIAEVGSNAQFLPFTASVGQPFVIDMVMENNMPPYPGNPYGPSIMAYNNIYSAIVYVGNAQMVITPSRPGATTLWNDYDNLGTTYDYYSMPLAHGTYRNWAARWAVQTPVAPGTSGPLTSLSLLESPPDLSQFQYKQMTLAGDYGNSAPAITASLDSIVVIGPDAPNPTLPQAGPSDSGGGGGPIDPALLAFLTVVTALRYRRT
jgi:hypothetical protein